MTGKYIAISFSAEGNQIQEKKKHGAVEAVQCRWATGQEVLNAAPVNSSSACPSVWLQPARCSYRLLWRSLLLLGSARWSMAGRNRDFCLGSTAEAILTRLLIQLGGNIYMFYRQLNVNTLFVCFVANTDSKGLNILILANRILFLYFQVGTFL